MHITLTITQSPAFLLSNLYDVVEIALNKVGVTLTRITPATVGATTVTVQAEVEPGSEHLTLTQSALQALAQSAIS